MAATALDGAVEDAATALQAAHEGELARQRALLGDAVFADVVRRHTEIMSSPELLAHYRAQRTDFERGLYRAYGRLELAKRMRDEPGVMAHYTADLALSERRGDDPIRLAEARVADLEGQRPRLGGLDPLTQARHTAYQTGTPVGTVVDSMIDNAE